MHLSAPMPRRQKHGKAAMSVSGQDQVATKADIAEIKAEIRVLKWMVGVNMALTMGLLWNALA